MTRTSKIKLRIAQFAFVFSMICIALSQGGCGHHTWMGLGNLLQGVSKDTNNFGRWVYNENLRKQNLKEHGIHDEHWVARIKDFVTIKD